MSLFARQVGIRRVSIILAGLTFSCCLAALTVSHLMTPPVSYEYLQGHLDQSVKFPNHDWIAPSNELQGTLSPQDMMDMSDILDTEANGLAMLGNKVVLQQQALSQQTEECAQDGSICETSIRINRTLKPLNVHGDFRLANILEESQRIDLLIDTGTNSFSIKQQMREHRNLRFIKTRDGWKLKTIDILEQGNTVLLPESEFEFDKVSGVNYYPASASWADFWKTFPKDEIESDLKTISSLGGNSIRIFLTHSFFNDASNQEFSSGKLADFLDMCAREDIKVLLTFFDMRADYRIENWEADTKHIQNILSRFSTHPALLGVDLKNEPDLDASVYGFDLIEAWITTMAGFIHNEYPGVPVTVGWSNSSDAGRVSSDLDFISYHDFKDEKSFSKRLNFVKQNNSDKPVMVTEIGSTVWTPPFSNKQSEKKQARRLHTQLSAATAADGLFIWTLNDFETVSSDVVGWRPWRKEQQAHYGMRRLDGSFRPSAKVFQDFNVEFHKHKPLQATNQKQSN